MSCYIREGEYDLTQRKSDREAQYAFYNLGELDEQAFVPPLVEVVRCNILNMVYASLTLQDFTDLAGIITDMNGEVKATVRRTAILLDTVKAQKGRAARAY